MPGGVTRAFIRTLLISRASVLGTDDEGLNAFHYAAQSANAMSIDLIYKNATQLHLLDIAKTKGHKNRNALHHLFDGSRYVGIAHVQYLTS